MKAQILFQDDLRINSERGKLEKAERELNELNDFLIENKLSPLTQDLAERFMKNPQEALKDVYKAMIPDSDKYTGLRNDKDKMLAAMQLPTAPKVENFPFTNQVIGLLYVFDFGKKVKLAEARLEEYLDGFRFVTDDPKIIEAYEDFQELAEKLTELNDRLHFVPLNGQNSINTDFRLGDILPLTRRGFELSQRGFMIATGLLRR